jgi:hypothetical protein
MEIIPIFKFKDSKTVTYEELEIDITKNLSTSVVMDTLTTFIKNYINKGTINFTGENGTVEFKMEDMLSVEFLVKGDQ